MRERLVAAFVALTLLVLVAFALARAYSTSDLVNDDQQARVSQSAQLLSAVLGERESNDEIVTSQYLSDFLSGNERVTYTDGSGLVVRSRSAQLRLGDGTISHTAPVAGGGTVTVTRSARHMQQQTAGAVLEIVLLGLGLVVVAAVAGWLAARHLARPFRELAGIAGEFGRGRFDVPIPRYSVPEADHIGRAMREAAHEVSDLVERERRFSVQASHRLRTPLTALRLELEDLARWRETPDAVRTELLRALTQLDRLGDAVTDCLALSRPTQDTSLNLTALVADTVGRWQPQARQQLRRLVLEERGPVPVRLPARSLSGILDGLIEQALSVGTGTVTVRVDTTEAFLRVQVTDDGDGDLDNDLDNDRQRRLPDGAATPKDLAVVAETAESMGGHLRRDRGPRPGFSLMLPKPGDRADPEAAS